MTNVADPQCLSCAHFVGWPASGRDTSNCAAFPDGIPDRIWHNQLDHRDPVDGDHGVRWEPANGNPGSFPVWAFE